jgi:general secretion pathway protein I
MHYNPRIPSNSAAFASRVRRRPARGFTLIEVLAAILILSIVVPSLMQAYTICGNIAALSRQRAEALAIAQSSLDEIVATQEWLNGTPGGEEKPGPTVYTWQSALTPWEEANTQLLTVTVHWTSAGQPQEVKLDTIVYTPDETLTTTTTGLP